MLGQVAGEIGGQIRTREDAVKRVNAINTFGTEASTELERLQTEADLSDQGVVSQYQEFLKKKQDELIQQYGGSPDSQVRLYERLESDRSQLLGRAGTLSAKIGREKVTGYLGKTIPQLANSAAENPGSLADQFKVLDREINELAGALPPQDEEKWRSVGRQQIVTATVENMIARGSLKEARDLLDNGVGPDILGMDDVRKIKNRLIIAETEERKASQAAQKKVKDFIAIVGRDPTEAERLSLAGAPQREGKQTLSDRVAEFERVVKRPATEEEIAQMGSAAVPGAFGSGIAGRSLEILTDDAPAFEAGLLDDAEERRFQAAVTQYTQPTTRPNPDTGLMETSRPELPPFVVKAYERRGMELPGQRAPSSAGVPEPTAPPDQTIWGLAGNIAGPLPAAGELIGKTPVVGEFFPNKEFTQARNYVPLVQRDLVRVLQNNPRYAEGERKAIEDEIKITPEVFDRPGAFQNRLIAIDQALEVREKNAFSTADPGKSTVGREERVQALNVLNAIVKFRQNLGVPPLVKNAEEAKALPSGTVFRTPKGDVRRVP